MGNQASGGGSFKQNDPRTTRQNNQRGGSRNSGTGYNLTNQDLDYPEE